MRNLIFGLILFSFAAEADDEIRINFSIGSIHSEDYRVRYRTEEYQSPYFDHITLEREVEYREYFDNSNPGVGAEFQISDYSYAVIGLYDNSYPGTTMSIYGGFGFDFLKTQNFALCGEVAIASGYGNNYIGGDLCARANIFGNHNIKVHYAPGEAFEMGTDVYAFEYQILFHDI